MGQNKIIIWLLFLVHLHHKDKLRRRTADKRSAHPRLGCLRLMIQRQHTKKTASVATSPSIRSCIVRNKEAVWLNAGQAKVDQLITAGQCSTLPIPTKVCLDN
jgi:hypothetical protein